MQIRAPTHTCAQITVVAALDKVTDELGRGQRCEHKPDAPVDLDEKKAIREPQKQFPDPLIFSLVCVFRARRHRRQICCHPSIASCRRALALSLTSHEWPRWLHTPCSRPESRASTEGRHIARAQPSLFHPSRFRLASHQWKKSAQECNLENCPFQALFCLLCTRLVGALPSATTRRLHVDERLFRCLYINSCPAQVSH